MIKDDETVAKYIHIATAMAEVRDDPVKVLGSRYSSLFGVTKEQFASLPTYMDNWKYYTFQWPLLEKPFLVHLTKGEHVVRLENASGGGLNLDYFVLVTADMELKREVVEK